jgi:hypothetical protein
MSHGADCQLRLALGSLTLQQVWDGCYPGDQESPRAWERPVILARVVVSINSWRMHPHRIGTDGQVLRLDVSLADGRTLRLLLPPDFPCEDLPCSEKYPPPPDGLAAALGFAPRDQACPVTDADRLVLDLAASPPLHPCGCTAYNGGQCYNCLNGAHENCPSCGQRNDKSLGLRVVVRGAGQACP